MNRLQSELQRLYLPPSANADAPAWVGADGTVRALVLELTRPASWEALSALWRGVQTELEWQAPGIAVSGTDALQLWFSLAEAVPAATGHAMLDALRRRFLADIAPARVRLWPTVVAASPHVAQQVRHTALVPAEQGSSGNWSAFVAPDLAPVFADTPWLDIPPGAEGQADLLSRLTSIKPSAWGLALDRLGALDAAERAAEAPPLSTGAATASGLDPKRFLLQVMGDDTVPLALRIEAAKALLPYTDKRPG